MVLYVQVESDLDELHQYYQKWHVNYFDGIVIALLLILMAINWLIESLKWKYLVEKLIAINFIDSLNSIIKGLAFGLITPFKIGEIFTRILHIDSKDRSRALGSLLVSRAAQLVSTIIFGVVGGIFFLNQYIHIHYYYLYLIFPLILLVLLIYFNLSKVIPFLSKYNFSDTYIKYIDIIHKYDRKDYWVVLFLSSLRYIVFVIQYGCMFYLYKVEISGNEIFVGISTVFFIKSVIPLNVLGEFGWREITAVSIFGIMGFFKPAILMVTISIWILNIILPSFLGSLVFKK